MEASQINITARAAAGIRWGPGEIWFLAWMRGPLTLLVGPIFATMMHRNLKRALAKLKTEIEASA